MDFDKLYDNHLHDMLDYMLKERIQYVSKYKHVSLTQAGAEVIIRWDGTDEDPNGDIDFSKRVIPYNFLHVLSEIKRQYNKINRKV